MTYSCNNFVFVDWLVYDECCLNLLETWYVLIMEGLSVAKWRSARMDMMLTMDHFKENFPLILWCLDFFSISCAEEKEKVQIFVCIVLLRGMTKYITVHVMLLLISMQ